jgi:inosine-uridine nucleoside N-ribohydrolase
MPMRNKRLCPLILVAIFACAFAGHHSTARGEPVRIIFDTDMGSDCDDAGALAVLHVYADRGLAEIVGCIYSSGKVPYGAGVVEAINIYYGRPEIPIGAAHDDQVGDPIDKMTAEKLAKDTAAFGNTIIHSRDAHEMTALNRRLLAREQDHSVVYLTVGHTKGFYDLLVSKPDDISPLSGRELVKKKIQRWVAMGALGANNKEGEYRKEWNFHSNGSAPYTKYLIENCPVPIVYIAAGSDVYTGKSLKTTPPGNIVRTVYRDWLWNVQKKTLDDQRPSWDLIALHYAVNGLGEYLVAEEDGWLDVDVDKGSRWIRAERKNPQTFVTLKPGMNQELADYLNRLLAAKPKRQR